VTKKNTLPFILRTVRWIFPTLEKVAPFISDRIFRLAFYFPVKYKIPQKEIDTAKESIRSTIEVIGKRIQIYSWGKQELPYVLLVHGWAGRATQFRKFIEPLKHAGYRIIAFDGPAHGNSSGRQTTILEFEQVLISVFEKFGESKAIITHSFGGAATLYSASQGLPVGTLITIATPTIANEILKEFLRVLNGSWASVKNFRTFVLRESGKTMEEFTALYSIAQLKTPIRLMIVQDEDDASVAIVNATELLKAYPSATLFSTKGLGHHRILKEDAVIEECINFIGRSDSQV